MRAREKCPAEKGQRITFKVRFRLKEQNPPKKTLQFLYWIISCTPTSFNWNEFNRFAPNLFCLKLMSIYCEDTFEILNNPSFSGTISLSSQPHTRVEPLTMKPGQFCMTSTVKSLATRWGMFRTSINPLWPGQSQASNNLNQKGRKPSMQRNSYIHQVLFDERHLFHAKNRN